MTTTTIHAGRRTTMAGTAVAAARAHAPGLGRWLARTARRARSMTLHLSGLAAISAAAWDVARPLGLLATGMSLLTVEWLTSEDDQPR